STDVDIKPRLPRKIGLGKARPSIYYKFRCQVQLSDGSVIFRKSQFPKVNLKIINDQRNNGLWNPSKGALGQVDQSGLDRLEKFNKRFGLFTPSKKESVSDKPETKKQTPDQSVKSQTKKEPEVESQSSEFSEDDYLSLLGENAQEVQSGGKLQTKKKGK
ncbi:mitochondrial 54S ribosomal protein bL31m, partial [Ascoidea rubescens DSM 1968]